MVMEITAPQRAALPGGPGPSRLYLLKSYDLYHSRTYLKDLTFRSYPSGQT